MTRHFSEEELVLYRYRELDAAEADAVARHLGACEACRREYDALERVLLAVDVTAPEPSPAYEREVWARIQDRLDESPRGWRGLLASIGLGGGWMPQAALAATVAALLIVSFVSLRHLPLARGGRVSPIDIAKAGGSAVPTDATDDGSGASDASTARGRVLLAALDEHLHRSEFMLTELNNLDGGVQHAEVDLSREQAVAEELVSDNRLYRRTAIDVGDRQTASLLDELERALLDVAHAPSSATVTQLDDLRNRLDAQGVLFKVRVAGAGMRERQMAAVLDPGASEPAGL